MLPEILGHQQEGQDCLLGEGLLGHRVAEPSLWFLWKKKIRELFKHENQMKVLAHSCSEGLWALHLHSCHCSARCPRCSSSLRCQVPHLCNLPVQTGWFLPCVPTSHALFLAVPGSPQQPGFTVQYITLWVRTAKEDTCCLLGAAGQYWLRSGWGEILVHFSLCSTAPWAPPWLPGDKTALGLQREWAGSSLPGEDFKGS